MNRHVTILIGAPVEHGAHVVRVPGRDAYPKRVAFVTEPHAPLDRSFYGVRVAYAAFPFGKRVALSDESVSYRVPVRFWLRKFSWSPDWRRDPATGRMMLVGFVAVQPSPAWAPVISRRRQP